MPCRTHEIFEEKLKLEEQAEITKKKKEIAKDEVEKSKLDLLKIQTEKKKHKIMDKLLDGEKE